ncbi:MAG: PAS domain-containing protein, partial [Candidatus Scalindua sp.]|nr:PAS domain-containing protein [Candidatus Scalindua sp.]
MTENDGELVHILNLIKETTRGSGVITDGINNQILAYTRLKGPEWYFISVLPKSYLESTALKVARFMILLGIFLLFFETLLLYMVLRGQVMMPLNNFIDASKTLARTDFSDSKKSDRSLPVERDDEVGVLARSFDDMSEQLSDYSFNLEQKIAERTSELEQKQKELTVQKRTIEETLENLEQGIIIVDDDFKILSYNNSFLEVFGIAKEKMREMSRFEEITEYYVKEIEKKPELLNENLERAKSRLPYSNEFCLPGGQIIEGRQIPIEGGGFVRTYTDVTAHRQELEEVKDINRQLNQAFSAGKLGTWNMDILNGTYVVNEENAKLFGYSQEDMNKGTEIWKRIIHPEDFVTVNSGLSDCIKGKQDSYHVEFRAYTSTGDLKWIESRGNVIERNKDGKALRITGTQSDISDRKKNELALLDTQQLIEAIVENSSFVIYVKNKLARYVLVNHAWEEKFSISRDHAMGKTGVELSSIEIAGPSHFSDLKIIESGEAIEFEEVMTDLDGNDYTYLSTKFPLYSMSGEISGVCCLSSDITDRKTMESSLRENQDRLDLALEVGSLGTFEIDVATQLTTVNEIYAKALGYELEELNQQMLSLGFFERMIYEEDYPLFLGKLETVLKGKSDRLECQFRAHRADGEIKWFDCNAIPVDQNEQGLPMRLVGTQADITERKVTEEHVRENQQLLDAVIQNNANIIYVKDKNGKYLLINKEYEKTMGVRRHNVIGKTDVELYEKDFAEQIRTNDLKVLNTRKQVRVEESVGASTFLSVKFPLFDSQGEITGFCGMSTDITEQKQMQDNLKNNQQLLEAVVQNSGSVIYVKDKNGKYILLNREFENAVNVKRADVIGKNDREIYPKEIAEVIIKNDKEVMSSAKSVRSEESPDSKTMFLSIKFPIMDSHGRVDGVGGISTDITDQKNLQNKLAFNLD